MDAVVKACTVWETFKTQLLLSDESASPLGRLRLAGTVAASTGIDGRRLDSYAIVLAVAGSGAYADELGASRTIVPGDLILLFPGLRHSYGPARGERWDEFYVVFDGPVFEFLERVGMLQRERAVVSVHPHELLFRELVDLTTSPRPSDERGRVREVCAFMRLLTGALVSGRPPSTWVDRAKALLASDLGGQLDLETVASELGMSYESFRKRFRAAAGSTPTEYRNSRRIETAREMLASTSLTIKQVAANLGYFDEYHFSRRFREAAGSAPGTYRRRVQESLGRG
jgi:AraC-like DNA-binding protein